MKSLIGRALLAAVPLFAMLMVSGCSGCEDTRLMRTCSVRSVSEDPCKGSGQDFELIKDDPGTYNAGICSIGTVKCLKDTTTLEEYCAALDAEPGAFSMEDCEKDWEFTKFDDVCVGYKGPEVEKCGNDLDDDCDGQVNEGYDIDGDGWQDYHQTDEHGHQCGFDCDDSDASIHPSATEVCDGKDNNCNCLTRIGLSNRDTNEDGIECGCSDIGCDENVDEKPNGHPITTIGVCPPEVPEGINIDDLVFEGTPCKYTQGKLGCFNGVILCADAEFIGPSPELCDGIDNNCNGFADEPGYVVGEGDACGSDVGVCEPGQLLCNPFISDMVCWDATVGTSPDVCDGLDNDCDTEVDEDAENVLCHNGCPALGYQYCVGGEYSICDAPGPTSEDDEPCNGIDDDCDGLVDEGQECECEPSEIGPNAPICTIAENMAASPAMTCGQGRKNCVCAGGDCQYDDCYLACDPWVNGVAVDNLNTWYLPCPSEQCDSWDHNCYGTPPNEHIDGLIDVPCNCDVNSPVPEIAQAAQNGNCEEGECTAGQQTCEYDNQLQQWHMMPDDCGAVGPTDEVCNELDDDCDGDVDEGLNSFDKVDMVFAIDITGSMGDEIQSIHAALDAYAQDFAQTEHRFALMLFPAPWGPNWVQAGSPAQSCGPGAGGQAHWIMTGGLVDVGTFLAALNTVLNAGLVCGSEPSYDVLAALTSVQDPAGVGWRNDAYPYVFLFGDEMAQTWSGLTENDIVGPAAACDGIGGCPCNPPDCPVMVNEFEIHCFVTSVYASQYDEICYNDVIGDNVYDINTITADVLRNIFADVCLPGNGNQQPPP